MMARTRNRPRKRSAPGRGGPRARVLHQADWHPDSNGEPPRYQRAAEHWLLDAATYLRDGDRERARLAARRALRALQCRGASC